ncbi:DUF4238 domain-containing protein [Jiangella alkaliphila]|uniref:DUF4238 domain-containing protein n=1 Tax=Jiangella alkaliphila TaxID=419479 RepID=UPI00389A67B2
MAHQARKHFVRSSRADGQSVSDDALDREWRDITKPGGPDLSPNADEHMRLLTSLIDGTSRHLYDCHWTLLRFVRRSLLTSDHPVSMIVGPEYPEWQGVGIFTTDLFAVPSAGDSA